MKRKREAGRLYVMIAAHRMSLARNKLSTTLSRCRGVRLDPAADIDLIRHFASRLLLPLLIGGLGSAVAAPAASGHAAFLGSAPGPGARLEAAPDQVSLEYTEPLNRRLTEVDLVRVEDGGKVAVSAGASSSRRLAVRPAAPLATGAYRVQWHTVSTEDGHALEGSFSFGVRAAAAGGGHRLEQSPSARYGWLRVIARFLLYATLLLFAGALVLRILLPEREGSWLTPRSLDARPGIDLLQIRARERSVVADLGAYAAGAAAVSALLEAADAAGGVSPDRLSDYLLANVAGVGRVAVVALVLLALAVWRRHARLGAALAAAGLAAVAVSGHASSASPRGPAVLNDWVHLLAGSVWLGGIALIVLVWRPGAGGLGREGRMAVARAVLPRFGRVAVWAFVTVSATGVVSLVLQLGRLDNLWRTAYGLVLLGKIVLVALIAAASWWHASRLRPRMLAAPAPEERLERRHWRVLRTEPLLALGVAVAAGLLVTFPLPPRQVVEADEALAAQPACDPCPLPRPAADELAVAGHAGTRVVAAWMRRDGRGVTGTVRVYDRDGSPSARPITVDSERQASCGPGCRRFATAASALRVTTAEEGRRRVTELPAAWQARPRDARRGRQILGRAQATMRALRSVRQTEDVSSGPGSFARTVYRLRAPNRLTYVTRPARSTTVVVGRRQWLRVEGQPWLPGDYGAGIGFSTRSWFRWTNYAQEVRVLRRWRRRGRRTTELALMDPGTPAWIRLTVDDATRRVVREQSITSRHFMTTTYSGFDRGGPIRVPRGPYAR